jgi:hypothetical protein
MNGLFVTSASACQTAAESLNLAGQLATYTSRNNPHGCYFKLSDSQLYFNAEGDYSDNDRDRVSICATLWNSLGHQQVEVGNPCVHEKPGAAASNSWFWFESPGWSTPTSHVRLELSDGRLDSTGTPSQFELQSIEVMGLGEPYDPLEAHEWTMFQAQEQYLVADEAHMQPGTWREFKAHTEDEFARVSLSFGVANPSKDGIQDNICSALDTAVFFDYITVSGNGPVEPGLERTGAQGVHRGAPWAPSHARP